MPEMPALTGARCPVALPGPCPAQVATEGPPGSSGPTAVGQQAARCTAALVAALLQAALMAAQACPSQQATLQQAGSTPSRAWETSSCFSVPMAIGCRGHAASSSLSECLNKHCSFAHAAVQVRFGLASPERASVLGPSQHDQALQQGRRCEFPAHMQEG